MWTRSIIMQSLTHPRHSPVPVKETNQYISTVWCDVICKCTQQSYIEYTVKLLIYISCAISGNGIVDHSDVFAASPVGSAPISNYIFILDLAPGCNGLGKDNCETRREISNFWNYIRGLTGELRLTGNSCVDGSCCGWRPVHFIHICILLALSVGQSYHCIWIIYQVKPPLNYDTTTERIKHSATVRITHGICYMIPHFRFLLSENIGVTI